jgi:hypothetical protein
VTSVEIDGAAADTVIAMVIVAVAMVVVVAMTIAVALATMTMIDAAMAADVIVMIATALETSIATRAVVAMVAMTAMEVVVIAAVTVAAIVVAAATMIVVMIVPASLPLETNHANLTQEAVETMAAATIATQVGRLILHMSTSDRTVSSEPQAYDPFRPQTMSPPTPRFRFPTCIPRLFTRLDGKLETASDSNFAAMTVVGFLITKATSAIAGSASLSTCIASNASIVSFILYYSSRRSWTCNRFRQFG